jgi:isopenicillin N synthase-like dioxygenase
MRWRLTVRGTGWGNAAFSRFAGATGHRCGAVDRAHPDAAWFAVAEQIQAACRERGFFYVTGHGVPGELLAQLDRHGARRRAWRGFFPVGAELTSGRPDLKEGLYFGTELSSSDPRARARVPLHAGNRINSFVQPSKRPAVARVDANLLPTFPIDLVDNSRFPMFR